MTWLHKRGLRDETIDRAELGWIRTDLFLDRQAWGLKPEKTEDGKDKKLWLPAGLVIPLMENDHVSRLRIRRPAGKPRYVVVSGSDMGPMTWTLDQGAVVIVESELDGLLIRQEAGDLVGVVALGSAQSKPDIEAERVLKSANTLLIALDYDKAGAEASYRHWLKSYPNARRWPVPVGKDPGEAFQMGLGIREWIEVGLRVDKLSEYAQRPTEAMIKPFPREWLQRFDESQLERLAIMTTDGQLSDQEAITLLNSG